LGIYEGSAKRVKESASFQPAGVSMAPKLRILAAAAAVAAVLAGPAGSELATPILGAPEIGTTVDVLPIFAWSPAAGADKYEFQVSADPGFSSLVADFFTKNTRAALKKPVPNGTYWWRVRGASTTGAVSPWSPAWSFEHAWGPAPTPEAPVDGETIVYPDQPLVLTWSRVSDAFADRV
jgi:hypothetical protein